MVFAMAVFLAITTWAAAPKHACGRFGRAYPEQGSELPA
jgi:hypothetical protein